MKSLIEEGKKPIEYIFIYNFKHPSKNSQVYLDTRSGTGEMAQWLRTFVALTQNIGLVHSTHMAVHKLPMNPVLGDPMPSPD